MFKAEDYTLLLVDDENDILEFLSYNLSKEGYKIHTCSNGSDALVEAKKIKPDLILLDIMMPMKDGIETCQEIREIKGLKNVLIMFLTARAEDYSQIAGFDAGADDYVTKPIKPKVLQKRIEALLKRAKKIIPTTMSFNLIISLSIPKDTLSLLTGKKLTCPEKSSSYCTCLHPNLPKCFLEKRFTTMFGVMMLLLETEPLTYTSAS